MRRNLAALLLLALLAVPAAAPAGEGDPLLSVDDLLTLEGSYEAFLSDVEELIVARGLLSEEERGAWHDAQLGDFYQNGGYGSILISYMPGVLNLVRGEETVLTLAAQLAGGQTLELLTMRRYTPRDSSLSGLMLTPTLMDADGVPMDVRCTFSAENGVFLKWDAMTGAYVSVGASAVSDGETVVWSAQTPAQDAKNPVVTIDLVDVQTGEALGGAALTLTVSGDGYEVGDGALEGTT